MSAKSWRLWPKTKKGDLDDKKNSIAFVRFRHNIRKHKCCKRFEQNLRQKKPKTKEREKAKSLLLSMQKNGKNRQRTRLQRKRHQKSKQEKKP